MDDVSIRAPQPSDDANAGYSGADYWLNRETGLLYRNLRVAAGAAGWQPLPAPQTRPGDLLPYGTFCWGTSRLRDVYSPPLCDVSRADGAAIGISADAAGEADWRFHDVWKGGQATEISRIYDQSNHGMHLNPSAYGGPRPNAPAYGLRGRRGACFDGFYKSLCTPDMPVGTAYLNNFALIVVARINNIGQPGILAAINGGQAGLWIPGSGASPHTGTPLSLSATSGASDAVLAGGVSDQLAVFAINSSPYGVTLSANDRSASGPAFSGDSLINIYMGDAPTLAQQTYWLNADIHAVFLVPRALSAGELDTFRVGAYLNYGIVPQQRSEIVLVGDSITWAGTEQNQSWARLLGARFDGRFAVRNLAIPGYQAALWAGIPALLTGLTAALSPAPERVICVTLGTNDLAVAGRTAAQVKADLTTVYQTILAASPTAKLMAGTILPRGSSAGFETARQDVNAWLRANRVALGLAGIVDFGADPTMGAPGRQNDPIYYNSDATHPTAIGCVIEAGVAAQAIAAL